MRDASESIAEMVEALLLFDEPILNHRFHYLLSRHVDPEVSRILQKLPDQVVVAERAARRGAITWMRSRAVHYNEEFLSRGDRILIESFLTLTENQIRLSRFMSRAAPEQDVAKHFDEVAECLREVATNLREATTRAQTGSHDDALPETVLRSVQEETEAGDIRGQVETAIRASRRAGKEPRRLLVSHIALRHLRDQGCFRNGETTLLDVPVAVDFGWDVSAFAVETFEVVLLEEITDNEPDEPMEDPAKE